ncbi:hypothetical protein ACIA5C_19210 [Actinoplanes sp. NPDC051343]|uniref:hypothetical protein n=1 Tax=Actinoplanes sp. NPDC051343 TaxID=3363906 RepID=UPI0037AA64A3
MEPVVILMILASAALLLLLSGRHRRPGRPAPAGLEPAIKDAPVAAGAPTVAGAPMAVGAPAPAAHFPTASAAARRHRNSGASHFTRPRANARVSR